MSLRNGWLCFFRDVIAQYLLWLPLFCVINYFALGDVNGNTSCTLTSVNNSTTANTEKLSSASSSVTTVASRNITTSSLKSIVTTTNNQVSVNIPLSTLKQTSIVQTAVPSSSTGTTIGQTTACESQIEFNCTSLSRASFRLNGICYFLTNYTAVACTTFASNAKPVVIRSKPVVEALRNITCILGDCSGNIYNVIDSTQVALYLTLASSGINVSSSLQSDVNNGYSVMWEWDPISSTYYIYSCLSCSSWTACEIPDVNGNSSCALTSANNPTTSDTTILSSAFSSVTITAALETTLSSINPMDTTTNDEVSVKLPVSTLKEASVVQTELSSLFTDNTFETTSKTANQSLSLLNVPSTVQPSSSKVLFNANVTSSLSNLQKITSGSQNTVINSTNKGSPFSTNATVSVTTAVPTLPPALTKLGIEPGEIAGGASLSATLADSSSFVMQTLNDSMKQALGYKLSDMLVSCTYNQIPCDMENDFTNVYNPLMGNCYTFNAGLQPKKWANRAGSLYGLKILLSAGQAEYSCTSTVAGFRVVIHENNVAPFPDTEGYNIPLKTVSSFSIFPEQITRLGTPYGECASTQFGNFNGNYSVEACQRECFQKTLLQSCKCADPRYPLPPNAVYCAAEQKLCLDYNQQCEEMLTDKCNCPSPCNETLFASTLSMSKFRPPQFQAENNKTQSSEFVGCNGTQCNDYAMVYVYYQDIKIYQLTETATYNMMALFSDVAGMSGILFGLSIITFFEFFFLLALCVMQCFQTTF